MNASKQSLNHTYPGRLALSFEYQSFDLRPSEDWSESLIEDSVSKIKSNNLDDKIGHDSSKIKAVNDLISEANLVEGKRVVLLGKKETAKPWLEAVLLARGAMEVTTIDRRRIASTHPKVKIIHPHTLLKLYDGLLSDGKFPFDVAILYDSVQSLGFGRFADGLHPWADLVTVARIWCLTEKEGKLMVTLPEEKDKDKVIFNSHRIYGPILKTNLFANWKLEKSVEGKEKDEEGREYPISMSILVKKTLQ